MLCILKISVVYLKRGLWLVRHLPVYCHCVFFKVKIQVVLMCQYMTYLPTTVVSKSLLKRKKATKNKLLIFILKLLA